MTTMDISALEALKSGKPVGKAEWQPLSFTGLHNGRYIAADPSLDAFGIVALDVESDSCNVLAAHEFKTESELGGWAAVKAQAWDLEHEIKSWLFGLSLHHDLHRARMAMEAPPIGGLKFAKPEISLIAGFAFEHAVERAFEQSMDRPQMLPMVRRQDWAKLICGNANVKKNVAHAALKKLYPQIAGSELVTNESKRDALCVALYAAHRGF